MILESHNKLQITENTIWISGIISAQIKPLHMHLKELCKSNGNLFVITAQYGIVKNHTDDAQKYNELAKRYLFPVTSCLLLSQSAFNNNAKYSINSSCLAIKFSLLCFVVSISLIICHICTSLLYCLLHSLAPKAFNLTFSSVKILNVSAYEALCSFLAIFRILFLHFFLSSVIYCSFDFLCYCSYILLLRYYNIKGAISNFEYRLNTSLQNVTLMIHINL